MQSTTNLSTYLSLSIWVPIIFGLIVLAVGRDSRAGMVRVLSLVGSLVSLLPTIPLITQFNTEAHGMQFVEKAHGSSVSTSSTRWALTACRCGSSR